MKLRLRNIVRRTQIVDRSHLKIVGVSCCVQPNVQINSETSRSECVNCGRCANEENTDACPKE